MKSALVLLVPACFLLGCGGQPAVVSTMEWDAEGSAKLAMQQFDTDGDGYLVADELQQCPAFVEALPRMDADGNGVLIESEVRNRILHLQNSPVKIIQGAVRVLMDGRPLVGATVTLTPEKFMGDSVSTVSGLTDDSGVAYLSGHNSDFPGIYLGYYRVAVSKIDGGTETIPAKYNTETTLGYEATDDRQFVDNYHTFRLSSG